MLMMFIDLKQFINATEIVERYTGSDIFEELLHHDGCTMISMTMSIYRVIAFIV